MATNSADDTKKNEILRRVRGLAMKHIEAGVSTGTLIICRACGYAKPLIGATCYGRHRLCNDCTLKYEMALVEKDVPDIDTFIGRKSSEKYVEA